jgi:glycosyltransferase involved in cell wall biosynthesis
MKDFKLLNSNTLVCFSHLRWNFVYQRPQHLISRFAKHIRVFFVEEPFFHARQDEITYLETEENLTVVQLYLKGKPEQSDVISRQQQFLSRLFNDEKIVNAIFWYYTPMAVPFTEHLTPVFVVYDCMDELSAFKFATPKLKEFETELFSKADVVFTGGYSLFESKKKQHPKTYCFPSSIDYDHFHQARAITFDPPDQDSIPHPRLGFYGVIDERLDIALLEKVARLRRDWQFILVGPVIKIDPSQLPNFHNIHYLGQKKYDELPHYLAGWDLAIIPFAHNESTRFISPTKTPEYLAGGKPVISTPVIDIIRPYGNKGLVRIAGTPEEFIRVAQEELSVTDRSEWLEKTDEFLAQSSWDKTWSEMINIINTSIVGKSNEVIHNIND